ncbi:MAG: tyrosine-type recombinase/integrase [Bryobacteraceae bacterium]
MPQSELAAEVDRFVAELARRNVSPNTVKAYSGDLEQFAGYFSRPDLAAPSPAEFETWQIREWLGDLYQRKLSAVSMRRKIAALRAFFKFLFREGKVRTNVARLVRLPKAPQKLPVVMTAEKVNRLVDDVGSNTLERPHPARDLAIFELLYGCGLRISELTGLNVEDLDREQGWLRVRGKGRKERLSPFGSKAAAAIQRYLVDRQAPPGEAAMFVNHRGGRLTSRGAHWIVNFYGRHLAKDPTIHPHSFRHAYATHMLADGADLRAIQELLGHARLSTTQRYTQVTLTELMAVYDKSHPKA